MVGVTAESPFASQSEARFWVIMLCIELLTHIANITLQGMYNGIYFDMYLFMRRYTCFQ